MNTPLAPPTPDYAATVVPVSRLVEAGLRRVTDAIRDTVPAPVGDLHAHAARSRRLSKLYARRARWFAVLERDTIRQHHIPLVYVQAVVDAGCSANREARFWADTAADWQALIEARPTSDVAGAMSNWHELGLPDEAPAPSSPAGSIR